MLLSIVHTNKSKVKILQNFLTFSEYMNFKAAKIAIDQTADEIDSKINDAIKRLQNISTP